MYCTEFLSTVVAAAEQFARSADMSAEMTDDFAQEAVMAALEGAVSVRAAVDAACESLDREMAFQSRHESMPDSWWASVPSAARTAHRYHGPVEPTCLERQVG